MGRINDAEKFRSHGIQNGNQSICKVSTKIPHTISGGKTLFLGIKHPRFD